MKYLKVWINSAGQRTQTDGLSLNQNSYDNDVILYTAGEYEYIEIFFTQPNGTNTVKYHMVPLGFEAEVNGVTETGYYAWEFPIPYAVTSFIMPSSSMKMNMSVACFYHTAQGAQLSPTMANAWVVVNRSDNTQALDGSYSGTDVDNLWRALGANSASIYNLNANALKISQLVTTWSNPVLNTNIPSEALVKNSLDSKLNNSQLINTWDFASISTKFIPNAQLTLSALNSKLDDSQLVSWWSDTVSDLNIPSEKLTKDSLDLKVDKSQVITGWNPVASYYDIPSEKLVREYLDTLLLTKVEYRDFTGANIASVIGTNPVQRAISDGNGNNIPNTYVAKSSLGASDGVATLDSNKKLSFSQIPDSLLGQLMYGGTINGAGVCSLSDSFKGKYGITSLTITENAPNSYSSVYFVATAQGAIAATESGVYPAIEYMTGDWIVSAGSSGYNKVDNTDAVQGVKGDADTEYKVGYVNLTPADIGSLSTQESYNNIGKLIQLDFTGTLSGNAITFTLSNPADEVALIDNNTYEIDLHFPAAGTILGSNTIVIHYGAANTEIKLYNVLNKSGTMTVADMKQIETYSSDTGWRRWIFNAIYNYNNTSGELSLTIPATVVGKSASNIDEHTQNMLHLGYYDTYTIDSNGNYVVTRQTGYAKFNGSETWEYQESSPLLRFKCTNIFFKDIASDGLCVSNLYAKEFPSSDNLTKTSIFGIDTGNYGFYVRDLSYSDLSSFLSHLSSTNLFIQYKLSTPYTETYDPLHFARIQPYALEYAKSEADRSSNLMPDIYLTSTTVTKFLMENTAFVLKAGTYSIKLTSDQDGESSYQYQVQFNNKEIDAGTSHVGSYLKFTLAVDAYNITIYCNGTNSNIKIMLNRGSVPLPYQPYEGEALHESFANTFVNNMHVWNGIQVLRSDQLTPTIAGVQGGVESNGNAGVEVAADTSATAVYMDLTKVGIDFLARLIYNITSHNIYLRHSNGIGEFDNYFPDKTGVLDISEYKTFTASTVTGAATITSSTLVDHGSFYTLGVSGTTGTSNQIGSIGDNIVYISSGLAYVDGIGWNVPVICDAAGAIFFPNAPESGKVFGFTLVIQKRI